jgi:hypothetical protein
VGLSLDLLLAGGTPDEERRFRESLNEEMRSLAAALAIKIAPGSLLLPATGNRSAEAA